MTDVSFDTAERRRAPAILPDPAATTDSPPGNRAERRRIVATSGPHGDSEIVPNGSDRIIRWPELKTRVNVSRVTWWRLIRAGSAPKAIRISPGCVGWSARAVDAWITARSEAAAT